MALVLVAAGAEQREALCPGEGPKLFELGGRRRMLEAGEVAASPLGPVDEPLLPVTQQIAIGAQLLEPEVHRLLPDTPRPEPHHKNAKAVGGGGRLVDALGHD